MSVFSTDDQGMDKTMKCLFDLGYQEMEERRDNDTVLMEVFNLAMDCGEPTIVLDLFKSNKNDILKNIFIAKKEWIEYHSAIVTSFVTSSSLDNTSQHTLKHTEKVILLCSNTSLQEKMNIDLINSKPYDMKRLTEVSAGSQAIVSNVKKSLLGVVTGNVSQIWMDNMDINKNFDKSNMKNNKVEK